jgi:hypothetical protein
MSGAAPRLRLRGYSWCDLEGGLGEYPRLEWGMVGGDQLDLDEMLARVQLGEPLVQPVVHGDQLAVDQQVNVALVGSDAGAGLGDDLGALEAQADCGALAADGLAVSGVRMVSVAVEAGRAASAVMAGVAAEPPEEPLPDPAQAARGSAARTTTARTRAAGGRWCFGGCMTCNLATFYLICWEKLATAITPTTGRASRESAPRPEPDPPAPPPRRPG